MHEVLALLAASAASTAFGSMCCGCSSRMISGATTRRIPTTGRAMPPFTVRFRSTHTDRPEVQEVVAGLRRVIDEFDRSRADRRDLSSASSGWWPTTAPNLDGRAAAVQFPPAAERVECPRDRQR